MILCHTSSTLQFKRIGGILHVVSAATAYPAATSVGAAAAATKEAEQGTYRLLGVSRRDRRDLHRRGCRERRHQEHQHWQQHQSLTDPDGQDVTPHTHPPNNARHSHTCVDAHSYTYADERQR
jgi:hypothetical protein